MGNGINLGIKDELYTHVGREPGTKGRDVYTLTSAIKEIGSKMEVKVRS